MLELHQMEHDALLRYHPNRYFRSRRFFKPLFEHYKTLDIRGGLPPASGFVQLNNRFIDDFWNPELDRFPVEIRPLDMNHIMGEMNLFWHVARWTEWGRNIFHFSPALTHLLRLTDVDDVLWDSIKFPYRSCYLWFGPQLRWSLVNPNHHVDGAYISEAHCKGDRLVEVILTTQGEDVDHKNPPSFILHKEVFYYFPFQIRPPISTIADAFEKTLRSDDSFNEKWEPPQVDPEAEEEARELGIELIQPPAEESAQKRHVRQNSRGLPVFREVLRLVINGLCYLSSLHREVLTRYAEPSAQKKLEQATTPQQRQRIQEKLMQRGYTKIKFCGESLERELESLPTGRELLAHWRRGHWRNQAFGKQHSQHKLLWIRPTLVRKDKADENLPGHVYDVEP
jgi:hypothetical protein